MVITTNKKIILVILLMVFFVSLLTFKWVYEPRTKEIEVLLKVLDEEYEKNRISFEISKIKEDLDRRVKEDLLKTEKEISWLLSKISDTFKFLNLELISLEPQPLEKGNYFTRMPVKVKTVCNYHDLGELISRLESSDKFVDVFSLEIKVLKERAKEEKEEIKRLTPQLDSKGFVLLEASLIIGSLYPNY